MRGLEFIHGRFIHPARIRNLSDALGSHVGEGSTLLDVGSGDGLLAAMVAEKRGLSQVCGVDVLVRSNPAVPTTVFDGRKIPHGDDSWDYVMAVDVLHHAGEQEVLFREMLRVARKAVLIKDHLCWNAFDHWMLLKMDGVGNDRHGVAVTGKYLSQKQWGELIRDAGAKVEYFSNRVRIYPWPLSTVFGRGLHCIYVIKPPVVSE